MNARTSRRRRLSVGVSLVESLIATFLLSLILVGTVNLTVSAFRAYGQVSEMSVAVEKYQGAARSLETELTKGFLTILPNDASPYPVWNTTTLGAASAYTFSSGGVTVQGAVYIVYPNTRVVGVYNTSGGAISLNGANALYDRSATSPTRSVLIYRANVDGTANPSSGRALWIKRFSSGSLVSQAMVTNKVHPAWNAVNFYRPGARYDSVQMTLVTGEQIVNRFWQSSHTTATTSGVANVPARSMVLPNATSSYNVVVP